MLKIMRTSAKMMKVSN